MNDLTPEEMEAMSKLFAHRPDPTEGTLGYAIRHFRRKQLLSQRDLAALAEVDFTYISKIENNRLEFTPSVRALTLIAKALEMEPDVLIELAQKPRIQRLEARIADLEAENAELRRKLAAHEQ